MITLFLYITLNYTTPEIKMEFKPLKPTPEEMDAFIEHHKNPYRVVTYSTYDKKRGGYSYFMSVHDNHMGHKHYHIDMGYVNFNLRYNNVTHLMLDNLWAESFIDFINDFRVKNK